MTVKRAQTAATPPQPLPTPTRRGHAQDIVRTRPVTRHRNDPIAVGNDPRARPDHAQNKRLCATFRNLSFAAAAITRAGRELHHCPALPTPTLFIPTRRGPARLDNDSRARQRARGRASLETSMEPRSPSALSNRALANDDFARIRPTDLAFSCKARAATTQPAGPGARRRPSTMVAPTSPNIKTIPARPCQMQRLVSPPRRSTFSGRLTISRSTQRRSGGC